jgi:hypothetical protein
MDIHFNCPRRGQNLSVEEKGAGMVVNCLPSKDRLKFRAVLPNHHQRQNHTDTKPALCPWMPPDGPEVIYPQPE